MQKININKIKPNPNNPRTIKGDKFKKLVNSLKEFPEMTSVRPVVVNKDMVILGGNMRYKAAIEAGWREIPVEIVDWPEDKQREFIIKDNVSGGEWDYDLLANEWEADKLDEWGLDVDWKDDSEVEEDEAPEVSSDPPVSKLGEVYQLGRHRLMCGDSTKIEDVEKLMNGQKADMVFTDPPYGVSYESHRKPEERRFEMIENDDKLLIDWIAPALTYSTGWFLFSTSWKVLKDWLTIGDQVGKLTNMIIWDKGGGGIGDLKTTLAVDFEVILAYNRGNKIPGKRIGSVWSVGKDGAMDYNHPTQKPVALPAFAIQNLSKGSILDLFGGSGSTLIACEQTNRTCYMMELDPKYCDVIRKRYHKFVTGNEEGWQEATPAI